MEEYEYECPDDLDQQTRDFIEVLLCPEKGIGPYGVKRDDSIEFVQWCLKPAVQPEDQFIIADVEEYLDVFVGI